jgi:hypothetical protein
LHGVPYERFVWITQSFPYPAPQEQDSFDQLICNLAMSHIPTVLHYTPRRILVTTWKAPNAH